MKTRNLVFVVDDNEISLSLLSRQLSHLGTYEVKTFSDGKKMLRDLYLKPKAILLDYYLDSIDRHALNGKEIMEIMKTLYSKIPVIMFSILDQPEKISELKGIGICDFVSKQENDFLGHIEKALKQAVC